MGRTGKAFVLQKGDGATSEAFTTVGGARENSAGGANEYVDRSDKDDAWRTAQANAANKSMSLTASGRFKPGDTSGLEAMRTDFLAGTIGNYRLLVEDSPSKGYAGAFQITSFEESGSDGDVQQYSATLESSGEITFGSF